MSIKKVENNNCKQNIRGIIFAVVVCALTAVFVNSLNLITP